MAVREEARGGLVRRALASVGLDPLAGRVRAAEVTAGQWEAGARGEELTAALLQPLADKGWGGFYDRALPGDSRANLDHVLLPPGAGLLVVVDSKLWSARRGPVHRARDGRLMHGVEDREGAVRALRFEARALAGALGGAGVRVPVVPVIAVHGARVAGGRFMLDGGGDRGVTVIGAAGLVGLLRSWAGEPVTVRVRYGSGGGPRPVVFPEVRTTGERAAERSGGAGGRHGGCAACSAVADPPAPVRRTVAVACRLDGPCP